MFKFDCNLFNCHFIVKMYVVTYETSSLENLIFLQHTLFHHACLIVTAVCVLFFTEVEMAGE